MWEVIGSIIVKYWVEFLLGLIVAGGGFFIRRYIKMLKNEQKLKQEELATELKESIKKETDEVIEKVNSQSQQEDETLQLQIDTIKSEMGIFKAGILSMQGKQFRDECDRLLEDGHVITLEEWEQLFSDHEVYNSLGGNHNGDMKFKLVEEKFKSALIK